MGVRCYTVHPPGRLPALLGRGSASTLRTDQSWIVRCTYRMIYLDFFLDFHISTKQYFLFIFFTSTCVITSLFLERIIIMLFLSARSAVP